MKTKQSLLLLILFASSFYTFGQNNLSGIVKDAKTNTPLPFAAIQSTNGKGVITNENGRFEIPIFQNNTTLKVSYVGYQPLTVNITNHSEPIEILLTQDVILINEIIVLSQDNYASSLLYKSIRISRKDANIRQKSKVFRRSYSYRDDLPSEHMEAFYSAKMRDGGVDYFNLKNGKYGVPSDTSFMNLQMTNLLENYKLFTNEYTALPASPLEYTSLKKLRKDFNVRIKNKYKVEKDTIIELHFEPFLKKDILFEGIVWIRQSNLIIEKIKLDIQKTNRNPFIIIPDPDLNKAERLDLSFIIGFKYYNEKAVFDYIHSSYKMQVSTPVKDFEVSSNTNFYFYDYDKPFTLPFFPKFLNKFHDYEKILCFPYDPAFWEKNFLIAETAAEQMFRKELESKSLFKNQSGQQAKLIQRRFEAWNPNWNIEPRLVTNREGWETEEIDEVLYINRKGVAPEYTLFAKTFIFLDYECYADSIMFKTDAIIDYRFCFSINRKLEDFRYLEDFMHLAKTHANNLQIELVKEFGRSGDCPKRKLLESKLNTANKKLDKAIHFYNQKLHSETITRRVKLSKQIHSELQKSFMDLEQINKYQ